MVQYSINSVGVLINKYILVEITDFHSVNSLYLVYTLKDGIAVRKPSMLNEPILAITFVNDSRVQAETRS